jgi:hypothetical protein
VDFLSKSYLVRTLDRNNEVTAHQAKTRVKIALNAKIRSTNTTFEAIVKPCLCPGTDSMIMRSLKVFLSVMAGRSGLSAYEVECLVEWLDRGDHDGWITWGELVKELSP